MAAEDPFLTVQRQMVGILADGHLGHEPRPRKALLDGLGKPPGDDDVPLAALASVLGPDVLQDDQTGRDILELLANFFADLDPHGAAVGAGKILGGDVVKNRPTWQVRWQRLAAVPTLFGWAGRSRSWRRVARRRGFRCRVLPGSQDLAGEEQELSGVELLSLAAITLAQELFELVLEFLVEVSLLGERVQQFANELMAGLEIGWEFAGHGRHVINTDQPHRRDNRFLRNYRM